MCAYFCLAAIASHWGDLFTVVRIVGAAYLIYVGWKMWNAPLDLEAVEKRGSRHKKGKQRFPFFT
ncbi:LysE family transporter [Marinobacter xestospongiae]|uniref:LysE family transporter n=1 Tax=Marinobacter xestospongiae TaxID=994319 RepID=UPI003371C962